MNFIKPAALIAFSMVLLLPGCSSETSGNANPSDNDKPTVEIIEVQETDIEEPASTGSSYGYIDPSVVIEKSAGETFIITVRANPSNGYIWTPGFDDSAVILVQRFYPDAPKMTGPNGTESFEFKCVQKGSTEIHFKYEKPFQADPVLENKVFKVTIR